jgi:hypothetical protein
MNTDNHNVRIVGPVTMSGANGLPLNLIPHMAEVVTPAVATTLPTGLLFVGVGGDVIVRPAGQGTWVTFKGVPTGTFLPIYINGVSEAAGTTATDMLICF